MGHHSKGFRSGSGFLPGASMGVTDRQSGRERDGMAGNGTAPRIGTIVAEALYRGFRVVMRTAIAIHFRRVFVVGQDRFPRRGAALLAANHPSTWSDVLLLETLLGRRLHFLAQIRQFHPRPRAVLLRIFGTLPVYASDSGITAERNEETFGRCRSLFDRGEVVAIFPEGISRTDRSLMPLRRGAARLALSYARPRGAGRSFALVPIALRYSERTAFRGDVTVRIGNPIAWSELRTWFADADTAAADRLTERIAGALRSLGVMPENPEDAPLLDALESIAAAREGSRDLATAEDIQRSISALRREDPQGHARLRRLAHAHARALKALRVSDGALVKAMPLHARPSGRRIAAIATMALPALAGAVIHAIPALLTRRAIRCYGYGPSQIAFARISAGFLFLTLWYAAMAWLFAKVLEASAVAVGAMLALSAALGMIALVFGDCSRPYVERWCVAWIARRHPGLVERARASEEALNRWIAERRRGARSAP